MTVQTKSKLLTHSLHRGMGLRGLAFFLFSLFLGSVWSCRPTQDAVIQYQQIPEAKWDRGQEIQFRFLITETHRPYYFDLLLRHNNNVEYADFDILATLSNGLNYERKDTLHLLLSNGDHEWRGIGVALTELSFTYLPGITFPSTGIYTLTLAPCSLRPSIGGIENVGVVLREDPEVAW